MSAIIICDKCGEVIKDKFRIVHFETEHKDAIDFCDICIKLFLTWIKEKPTGK